MIDLNLVDPSHNILRSERKPLDSFFQPKTIAVIGATDKGGSVGKTILWNLMSSPFGGTVFPVNPKRSSVLGIQAYPSLSAIPVPVDLAVIVTPASTVPALIRECAEQGVKSALIISAGFKEVGEEGVRLEQEILEISRQNNLRIIGPNCLGVMNATIGLNATFASTIARPGKLAFLSQSGALCTAVLDWSIEHNVGFSKFVSIGSMLDVDWGDLIYYLGDDPDTDSILIYMETIGDARSFMSAAREIALIKPIIVIKPGRTQEASKAAASHTGSLSGSDAVLDAAFKRAGILRVDSIGDLFGMADVLSKQPRLKGPHLTILTNAGGPGVLATDSLIQSGGKLTELSESSINALNKSLPEYWSHGNPVDILGDAGADRYAQAAEVVLNDPSTDGLLVVLTPQAMSDPLGTAQALAPVLKEAPVPVLASWMGGRDVRPAIEVLNRANIPTYQYPDEATQTFSAMWQFAENIESLYETPTLPLIETENIVDIAKKAAELLKPIRESGRTTLTEWESKQLLSLYHIPTVETRIATTADEAVVCADAIGYPVVLKLHSETITHKSDVNGVLLNLRSAEAVREGYAAILEAVSEKASAADFMGVTVQPMAKLSGTELIIGSSTDSQFGPVILFGSGGKFVEVYKDSALGLPPLNTTLAHRMMRETNVYKILKGTRDLKPVDLDALAGIIVQFSQIVMDHPSIQEIDINPLLASADGFIALDARVILYEPSVQRQDIPKPAIRPYPAKYVGHETLSNNTAILVRPIRPEDEPLMIQFHKELSEETISQRYEAPFDLTARTTHERMSRICFNDYDREIALVAVHEELNCIMGALRMARLVEFPEQAVIRMLVADRFQGAGLGSVLMKRALEVAKSEEIQTLLMAFRADNVRMKRLCEKFGFTLTTEPGETKMLKATLELAAVAV